jgi:hypothetical protein
MQITRAFDNRPPASNIQIEAGDEFAVITACNQQRLADPEGLRQQGSAAQAGR